MSPKKRLKMVNKMANISLTRQCKILRISRSSLYYTPMGFSAKTLELMRQIDRVFTKYPLFGSRQITAYLPRVGYHAPEPSVVRRYQLYPGKTWLSVSGGNPLADRGVYTPRSMDWATRKVLSWRLSNTMDASFCKEALDEAITEYGPPEIMNTDQGSQFTGSA